MYNTTEHPFINARQNEVDNHTHRKGGYTDLRLDTDNNLMIFTELKRHTVLVCDKTCNIIFATLKKCNIKFK